MGLERLKFAFLDIYFGLRYNFKGKDFNGKTANQTENTREIKK